MQRVLIPVRLPEPLYRAMRGIKRLVSQEVSQPLVLDLQGDRDVERSYIASRLPPGEGQVLDFGCGDGQMSIHAIHKGYTVLALDLQPSQFPWTHPNLRVTSGDLLRENLSPQSFDFILNCSTVEHVGLTGRYGVAVEENDGDLHAMLVLSRLLKPGGRMIMTIPCGQDATIAPFHRVYGRKRLPLLITGYGIEEELYWTKHDDNCWHPTEREQALNYVPTSHPTLASRCVYALGCFVLRKQSSPAGGK